MAEQIVCDCAKVEKWLVRVQGKPLSVEIDQKIVQGSWEEPRSWWEIVEVQISEDQIET
jgi:hypothetical protein